MRMRDDAVPRIALFHGRARAERARGLRRSIAIGCASHTGVRVAGKNPLAALAERGRAASRQADSRALSA